MANTADSDLVRAAGLVTRQIRNSTRDGEPTKIIVARRRYTADRPDVWDAITNPERLPRWFLPISGDLSVGGRYQLEGNAGGLVETCKEPETFTVTWEFGGQVSWLTVNLDAADGGTVLELVHEAPVVPEFWDQFGPGAVGIGWDLGLLGLGLHLDGSPALEAAKVDDWSTSPEGTAFVRHSGDDWCAAAIGSGDDPDKARASAEAAIAFYTTIPES